MIIHWWELATAACVVLGGGRLVWMHGVGVGSREVDRLRLEIEASAQRALLLQSELRSSRSDLEATRAALEAAEHRAKLLEGRR